MTAARRRKPDPISNPMQFGNPIDEAVYHVCAPLDRIAREMESKWGPDRLPSLVAPESASKFGSAKGKLDAAILANDVELVTRKVGVLMRGWQALDREATEAGHPTIDIEAWFWRDGTQPVAVCRTNAEAHQLVERIEGVRVYTIPEIARIVEAFEKRVPVGADLKTEIGDCKVVRIREPWDEEVGDDVPF